jgi:hypothetical protein
MLRTMLAAALTIGLLAAPLPALAQYGTTSQEMKTESKVKKPPSAAQLAERERIKKCGAEWKAAKAAGKIAKGMKWPQYWSACNKRLKGGV